MARYLIDTPVWLDFINRGARGTLLAKYAPASYLSAVVAFELRAGVTTKRSPTLAFLDRWARRTRFVLPSRSAFLLAGDVVARARTTGGIAPSFPNDALIAMQALCMGAVVLTTDPGDFARIARLRRFELEVV
jgi:predicted nucleic acid-binding protein